MKNLFTSIILIFAFQALTAQATVGFKLTSPTVSSKETYKEFFNGDAGILYGLTYQSTRTSAAYGASFHTDFKPGWLTIDLMYRKRTVFYQLQNIPVAPRAKNLIQDNFQELSIPVLAGLSKNNFKIGLGAVFNLKLESNYGLKDVEGFTINPRALNTGFQCVVGYVIKDKVHIDLKREIGFNQVGEDYKSMDKLPQFQ